MEGRVNSSMQAQLIGYLNISEEPVPSFSVLQLAAASDISSTGTVSVKTTKPTADGAHYILDAGKGAAAADDANGGSYGQGVAALESIQWAYYLGDFDALVAWVTEVGPEEDHWDLTINGTGFVYAGVKDEVNHRIQVRQLAAGGGGTIKVGIAIESFEEDYGIATCVVTFKPCGASVPEMTDGRIQMKDELYGCLLDEPAADLIGRRGTAIYMQSIYSGLCSWQCDGLCCPES